MSQSMLACRLWYFWCRVCHSQKLCSKHFKRKIEQNVTVDEGTHHGKELCEISSAQELPSSICTLRQEMFLWNLSLAANITWYYGTTNILEIRCKPVEWIKDGPIFKSITSYKSEKTIINLLLDIRKSLRVKKAYNLILYIDRYTRYRYVWARYILLKYRCRTITCFIRRHHSNQLLRETGTVLGIVKMSFMY